MAIKVLKNGYDRWARVEIKILMKLKKIDREDKMNIIKVLDTFIFRGHRFIVFELLYSDLYSVIKGRQFVGMDLSLVKRIAV